MSSSELVEQTELFFKALGDASRLRLVGVLAHGPHSVEELAAILGLTAATVSHHLQRLLQANLVQAQAQQYYSVYSLRAETLQQMAEHLASADWRQALASDLNRDTYSAKVLGEYLVRGRLKELPSQFKKREMILRHLAQEFQPGKPYTEKRVNEVLKAFYSDADTLRRELVKHKLLKQEQGEYRRVSDGNAILP
jgi:biotin operon repressor